MKHSKLSILGMMLCTAVFFVSCEQDTFQQESQQKEKELNLTTTVETPPLEFVHLEDIKESLELFEAAKQAGRAPLNPTYWCSEQLGGYTSGSYINHGVYLNEYYVPDETLTDISGNDGRWATWMSDLQSWLTHDFNDPNPSGSYTSFSMQFDVYGAGGGSYLSATDANRAYNEFVCRLMDQLNVSSASDLNNYEFSTSFTVDYLACCVGSSCCYPILFASGEAYQ